MLVEASLIIVFVFLSTYFYFKARRSRQLKYIESYRFHPSLEKKVLKKYPHLTDSQITTVFDALRDYFTFCNQT
jgi:hypothetical protein